MPEEELAEEIGVLGFLFRPPAPASSSARGWTGSKLVLARNAGRVAGDWIPLFDMNHYSQAILTVLSLINPVICGVIFTKCTAGRSFRNKISDATRTILVVAIILSGAALAGSRLLSLFGISLDAFQAAGGLVLMWMGFLMLSGGAASSSPTTGVSAADETSAPAASGTEASKPSMAPLILFAASPGTITGVITLSVAHSRHQIPVTALVAIGVALAVTWLIVILGARAEGGKKPGELHDLTTRFMGLIVLSMGVQFLLTGIKAFFTIASAAA